MNGTQDSGHEEQVSVEADSKLMEAGSTIEGPKDQADELKELMQRSDTVVIFPEPVEETLTKTIEPAQQNNTEKLNNNNVKGK